LIILNLKDIGGNIVKQDDRYVVKDNKFGNNLVISSTRLFAYKETSGHSHDGQEEVYFFVEGNGIMELDKTRFTVRAGDVVPIKDGVFHKVYNDNNEDLYFVCVFDGNRAT
jgi:mannose-6-phosphate isomerase-like protein (cupin superfamily)|tara:strand:+ start:5237 stop:5569 length:333 start_codon:yes stop_codon:yes gene_type:complete